MAVDVVEGEGIDLHVVDENFASKILAGFSVFLRKATSVSHCSKQYFVFLARSATRFSRMTFAMNLGV